MDLIIYILVAIVLIALFFVISAIVKRTRKTFIENSIEIFTEKYEYYHGQKITGKVVLKFNEPILSKKLIVGLRCEEIQEVFSKKRKYIESHTLFEVNETLEHEKNYSVSEYSYDFSIATPGKFFEEIEGPAGVLSKSVRHLEHKDLHHKWYLYVQVQCADVDFVKKMSVNIR